MKGEDDSELRRKALEQKHDPQPQDIDIVQEKFDFSKWQVRKHKTGTFYTIIRRDGEKFKVNLPDGSIHRVSVLWIE